MEKKDIKIIGSGWACASFIKNIDNTKYKVSVVSNNSKFLYTPLLANHATHNIILEQNIENINSNITSIHDEVTNIDFYNKKIITNNKNLDYDYLIFCHGAQVNTFNIEGVDKNTYFLKDKNDINNIREKIKSLQINSNIVVIGCGPTGTELIGNLMDTKLFNVYAIDGLKVPLSMFSPNLSNYTIDLWKKKNVKMFFDRFVQKVDKNKIYLKDNEIKYDMAIWCGGIKPNYLTTIINQQLNNQCRFGIPVTPTLNIVHKKSTPTYNTIIYELIFGKSKYIDYKNIYAMGDCAYSKNQPTAQVAVQQGKYLADRFNNNFKDDKPFQFENKGQICYVGDKKSVYQLNKFTSSGTLTYHLNKLIHLYNAINFKQSKTFFKDIFIEK